MTRIEDMSETERQSWIALLADGVVFFWFWQKMTFGRALAPEAMSLESFGRIILGLVILTIILHAIIAAFFEFRKRREAVERDERDLEIERKGAHMGYRFMQIGTGCVVVGVFLSHRYLGADYLSTFPMQTPVQIIFYLLVVSYLAALLKQAVMIIAYRR